mgnify:CR=1 FL=1
MKKQELSVFSMQGMERRSYKSPTMKACKLGSARILSGSVQPRMTVAGPQTEDDEVAW